MVRGELYAILIVVQRSSGHVVIITDSKVNADLYWKGELHCLRSANADLWKELWTTISDKSMTVILEWSKGHADDPDVFARYSVSRRNLFGNLCADRLAERGAELAQVALQDAMNVRFHYALARNVQERAVVIMTHALQRKSTMTAAERSRKLRRISATGQTLSTQHRVVAMSRSLHCSRCLRQSVATMQGRLDFLASPCEPDTQMIRSIAMGNTRPVSIPLGRSVRVGQCTLHSSHVLRIYRGLYFCTQCGYTASAKAQKLVSPCTERGQAAQKRAARLLKGVLPSGMTSWPSETTRRPHLVELQTGEG